MSQNMNHTFIVLKYAELELAEQALSTILTLKEERIVTLKDAVVVSRKPDGGVKLHQTIEPSMEGGAVIGSTLGFLLAFFIAAAPLAMIIAGAAIGGAAFGRIDRGIDNKALFKLARNLKPEEGVLCLLIKNADWAEVQARLDPLHGDVVTYNLTPEALQEFDRIAKDKDAAEAIKKELM